MRARVCGVLACVRVCMCMHVRTCKCACTCLHIKCFFLCVLYIGYQVTKDKDLVIQVMVIIE